MPPKLSALEFIESPSADVPGVCVIHGDEPFLAREAILTLRQIVLGDDEGEFSFTSIPGDDAQLRTVIDELSTVALFGGGRRLVVVERADDFVKQNRAELEEYASRPKARGVLVLEVRTWMSTTRLAKIVLAKGLTLECKAPHDREIARWLVRWSSSRHHAALEADAAALLVELVGPEVGLLDQELAKLASAVQGGSITAKHVRELVGGWRTRTTWDMIDAALAGDAAAALVQLDRLLLAGEVPIAILAMWSASLRKFAAATRMIERAESSGESLTPRAALAAVGVNSYVVDKSTAQLRQVGRRRAGQLFRILLDTDLALKGVSSGNSASRLVIERLIVRLSKAAAMETKSV